MIFQNSIAKSEQGPQGTQGLQGFQGVQGPQGFEGFQGWQGDTGFQGVQGFQGIQGPQGFEGFQGVQGPQGFQGFQGIQGPQGFEGFQGVQGPQGFQGFQGIQGPQGFQGPGFETISSATNNHVLLSDGTSNSAKASSFVYTDDANNLHIDGNIIQLGATYSTHAEQIYTTSDYIILRDGATAGLSAGQYAGFQARLYDGVNDGRLVFDKDGFARVGDVGSEQILATRDVLSDKKIPVYDASSYSLKNSIISVETNGYVGINTGVYAPSGALDILNGSGSGIFRIQGGSTTNFYSYLNPMVFQTNSSTSRAYDFNYGATSLMSVLANGNVGIGTTSPDRALQVNGNFRANNSYIDSSSTVVGQNTWYDSLRVLNKASSGFVDLLVRNTTGTEVVYDAPLLGRITFSNTKYLEPISTYGITTNGWLTATALSASKLVGAGTLDLMYADNASKPYFRVDGTYAKIMAGTSTLMSVDINGNVGVGISAPTQLLTLQKIGSISSTPTILFNSTTIADNTTPYSSGAIYTKFDGSGYATSRLTLQSVNSSGTLVDTISVKNSNVGIGTTGPRELLDIVAGNVMVDMGKWFGSHYTGNDTFRPLIGMTAAGTIIRCTDSDAADGIDLQSYAGSSLMFLKNDGTGIGIGTTAPSSVLQIEDKGKAPSNGYILGIHADDQNPYLAGFFNDTYSTTIPVFEYFGYNTGEFSMGTQNATSLNLYTNGYNNKRLTITSAGNVGVSTVSPSANFQVNQPTSGSGTVSTIANSTTVTGVNTQFINTFKIGDTITVNGETRTIAGISSNTVLTTDTWQNTNNSLIYTLTGGNRFQVFGNGQVTIGKTSTNTAYNLDVKNTINIGSNGYNGTLYLGSQTDNNGGGSLGVDSNFNLNLYKARGRTSELRMENTGTYFLTETKNVLSITNLGTNYAYNVGVHTTTPSANFQVNQMTSGAGTVTITGNTTCTGTGTQFTNTFRVGDNIIITATSETRAITAITSDTVMTIASATNTVGSAYTLTGGTRFQVRGNGNTYIGTRVLSSTLYKNEVIAEDGQQPLAFFAQNGYQLIDIYDKAGIRRFWFGNDTGSRFQIKNFVTGGDIDFLTTGTGNFTFNNGNVGIGYTASSPTYKLDIIQSVDGGNGIQLKGTGTGADGYAQFYISDANGGKYLNINSSHATAYRIGGSLLAYFNSETFNLYGSGSLPKNRIGFSSTLSMGYNYTDSKWYFADFAQSVKYMTYIPGGAFIIGATAVTAGTQNALVKFEVVGRTILDSININCGAATVEANRIGYRNIAMGDSSLGRNTTGSACLAIGYTSLVFNTTGIYNTGIGYQALYSNTAGWSNIAVGTNALTLVNGTNSTLGSRNTGIGDTAGGKLTTGYNNTFIGCESGNDVLQKVDAINSMALGYQAYTTANNQIVIGNTSVTNTLLRKGANIGIDTTYSLSKTLTVGGNFDFNKVGGPNTSSMTATLAGLGAGNLGNGVYSYQLVYVTSEGETEATNGTTQVTVVDNTTNGQVIVSNIPVPTDPRVLSKYLMRSAVNGGIYFCQKINVSLAAGATSYTDNNADASLVSGTTAYRKQNTTAGLFYNNGTLFMSSPDIFHTTLGVGAGVSNTTGNSYVIIGGLAGGAQTTASDNCLIGYSSGNSITTGGANTALGTGSLMNNTTGTNNVALGNGSLRTNVNGAYAYNTAVGTYTLYAIKPGSNYNTAIGYQAGNISDNTTGTLGNNIFLGQHLSAYNLKTGDYNLLIGNNADIPVGETIKSNYLNIADTIFGTTIYAASTGGVSIGKIGIGVQAPASKLDVNGGVKVADDLDAASATKVGTLRYRTSGNNSYCDMCMQTGATAYEWINITQNNW